MSKVLPLSLLIAVCLQAFATAQSATTTSPKIAAAGGTSGNSIPFSWYPVRYQQVHDYDTFVGSPVVPVKSVNFRLGKKWSTGLYGGQSIVLSMWMAYTPQGTTPITSKNASMTFAKNLDAKTLVQVVNKKTIVLPKSTTFNFGLKIPISKTFLFSSGFKKSLVIETRVYSNSSGSKSFTYPIDAWNGSAVGSGSYKTNGSYSGCKAKSGSFVSHYAVPTGLKVGSASNFSYGYGRAASLPALMSLGALNLNITLPGTSCKIVNDLLAIMPGLTSASSNGYYRVALPIPNDPKLANIVFKTQMFFFQKGANSFGITSTRGLDQKIGPGNTASGGSVKRFYAYSPTSSYNPDLATTATGSTSNYGLVTQITN
jgi:hypothetical protein